ncbi:MAG: hypothetical protein ABIP48_28230 [Planctomycetota bacterium]
MNDRSTTRAGSRRGFFKTMAAAAAGLAAGGSARATAAAQADSSLEKTVRDRLWIWSVFAGGDNKYGLPKPSRMTPAESAFYLGIPNLFFIRSGGIPPLEMFDQYAVSFRPLERVVWSLVGAGGRTAEDERKHALELAHRFPNIAGFIMDDFFHKDGTGSLSPEELKDLRNQLVIDGRKRDLYVVVYQHQMELAIQDHLQYCDKITFWTWWSERLGDLEKNFERLEKLAPEHGKLLGCYMWDYPNRAAVPLERMKHQCTLGLRWLREGRIEGMIFLGSTVCDLELEVVEWVRRWIAEVGDQPV